MEAGRRLPALPKDGAPPISFAQQRRPSAPLAAAAAATHPAAAGPSGERLLPPPGAPAAWPLRSQLIATRPASGTQGELPGAASASLEPSPSSLLTSDSESEQETSGGGVSPPLLL